MPSLHIQATDTTLPPEPSVPPSSTSPSIMGAMDDDEGAAFEASHLPASPTEVRTPHATSNMH